MIPNDPVILLSFINTKLRDNYASLHELCSDFEVNEDDIKLKLDSIGYSYSSEQNRFV
ncbi:MAG: DUF4250 domain-containing protein [Firmicutes bacterium]|nr:DUF4250 domain-containing protein [Bacillota bacterium]